MQNPFLALYFKVLQAAGVESSAEKSLGGAPDVDPLDWA